MNEKIDRFNQSGEIHGSGRTSSLSNLKIKRNNTKIVGEITEAKTSNCSLDQRGTEIESYPRRSNSVANKKIANGNNRKHVVEFEGFEIVPNDEFDNANPAREGKLPQQSLSQRKAEIGNFLKTGEINGPKKFSTATKIVIGIFTFGIGPAIMSAIERSNEKAFNIDKEAFAGDVVKLKNELQKLENNESKDIEIIGVNVRLSKDGSGSLKVEIIKNGNVVQLVDNPLKADELMKNIDNNIVKNIPLYGRKAALEIFQTEINDNDHSKKARLRDLAEVVIRSARGIKQHLTSNVDIGNVINTAREILEKGEKSADDVGKDLASTANTSTINSEKIIELIDQFNADETASTKVVIEKADQKEVGAANGGPNELSIKNEEKTKEKMRSFLADLIYSEDTWEYDNNTSKPGERLKKMLLKHADVIAEIMNDESQLDVFDEETKNIIGSDNAGNAINNANEKIKSVRDMTNNVMKAVKAIFNFLSSRPGGNNKQNKEDAKRVLITNNEIRAAIDLAESLNKDKFAEIEGSIDSALGNIAEKMQADLDGQFEEICSGSKKDQVESSVVIEQIKICVPKENNDKIKQYAQALTGILELLTAGTDSDNIEANTDVAKQFKSGKMKQALTDFYTRSAQNLTMMSSGQFGKDQADQSKKLEKMLSDLKDPTDLLVWQILEQELGDDDSQKEGQQRIPPKGDITKLQRVTESLGNEELKTTIGKLVKILPDGQENIQNGDGGNDQVQNVISEAKATAKLKAAELGLRIVQSKLNADKKAKSLGPTVLSGDELEVAKAELKVAEAKLGKAETEQQKTDAKKDVEGAKSKVAAAKSYDEIKRGKLDDLVKNSGTDLNSDGYGKFVKEVMNSYLNGIDPIDKRSMFAAGIRYYRPSPKPVKGNDESDEKYRKRLEEHKKKEGTKLFGAMLKGAGPLMQKTLQGLHTEDENFNSAIADMKSNLTHIPDKIVQAYLLDTINKSNGKITKITVKRVIGAASVGEALLCEIVGPGENGQMETKECVIKLLRPDALNRMRREEKIFKAAAEKIPGMGITFEGQLKTITEEMDLTKEKKNIEAGKVYNDPADTSVESVKINNLARPTPNVLVLEKAPGYTIDSYLKMDGENSIYSRMNEIRKEHCDQNKLYKEGKIVLEKKEVYNVTKNIKDHINKLKELRKEVLTMQESLLHLSRKWVHEGIYGKGFYHGDLHAGNMMIEYKDGKSKLTVIDFGNATQLDKYQQQQILLMMASAAAGNKAVDEFMRGFHSLLSGDGKKVWDEKQGDLEKIFSEILGKENQDKTGERIIVALSYAQKLGIEVPAPIFNFSQCQIRLSNTIDSMNKAIKDIEKEIETMYNAAPHPPDKYIKDEDEKEIQKMLNTSPDTFVDCMSKEINKNVRKSLKMLGASIAQKLNKLMQSTK